MTFTKQLLDDNMPALKNFLQDTTGNIESPFNYADLVEAKNLIYKKFIEGTPLTYVGVLLLMAHEKAQALGMDKQDYEFSPGTRASNDNAIAARSGVLIQRHDSPRSERLSVKIDPTFFGETLHTIAAHTLGSNNGITIRYRVYEENERVPISNPDGTVNQAAMVRASNRFHDLTHPVMNTPSALNDSIESNLAKGNLSDVIAPNAAKNPWGAAQAVYEKLSSTLEDSTKEEIHRRVDQRLAGIDPMAPKIGIWSRNINYGTGQNLTRERFQSILGEIERSEGGKPPQHLILMGDGVDPRWLQGTAWAPNNPKNRQVIDFSKIWSANENPLLFDNRHPDTETVSQPDSSRTVTGGFSEQLEAYHQLFAHHNMQVVVGPMSGALDALAINGIPIIELAKQKSTDRIHLLQTIPTFTVLPTEGDGALTPDQSRIMQDYLTKRAPAIQYQQLAHMASREHSITMPSTLYDDQSPKFEKLTAKFDRSGSQIGHPANLSLPIANVAVTAPTSGTAITHPGALPTANVSVIAPTSGTATTNPAPLPISGVSTTSPTVGTATTQQGSLPAAVVPAADPTIGTGANPGIISVSKGPTTRKI